MWVAFLVFQKIFFMSLLFCFVRVTVLLRLLVINFDFLQFPLYCGTCLKNSGILQSFLFLLHLLVENIVCCYLLWWNSNLRSFQILHFKGLAQFKYLLNKAVSDFFYFSVEFLKIIKQIFLHVCLWYFIHRSKPLTWISRVNMF